MSDVEFCGAPVRLVAGGHNPSKGYDWTAMAHVDAPAKIAARWHREHAERYAEWMVENGVAEAAFQYSNDGYPVWMLVEPARGSEAR